MRGKACSTIVDRAISAMRGASAERSPRRVTSRRSREKPGPGNAGHVCDALPLRECRRRSEINQQRIEVAVQVRGTRPARVIVSGRRLRLKNSTPIASSARRTACETTDCVIANRREVSSMLPVSATAAKTWRVRRSGSRSGVH